MAEYLDDQEMEVEALQSILMEDMVVVEGSEVWIVLDLFLSCFVFSSWHHPPSRTFSLHDRGVREARVSSFDAPPKRDCHVCFVGVMA
jgi:hypothetical protein